MRDFVIAGLRGGVIPGRRYTGAAIYRGGQRGKGPLLYFSGAVALGIGAAAPEFFAGVDAFLGHALDHGFAAEWAGRGVLLGALFCTMCQSFSGEGFSKAAFFTEGSQLVFYLAANHQDESVAEHQHAVGYHEGV